MPIPKQPKPAPIPERLKALQTRISKVQRRIEASELTAGQRRLGKLPAPQAVERVRGGTALGEARSLKSRWLGKVAESVGVYSPKTEVALTWGSARRAPNIPRTVRHEAAHHILRRQGETSTKVQHTLMEQAAEPLSRRGVNFPLLSMARRAKQAGGPTWAGWLERRQEKLRFRQMRFKGPGPAG
jgi:hypothetical protein